MPRILLERCGELTVDSEGKFALDTAYRINLAWIEARVLEFAAVGYRLAEELTTTDLGESIRNDVMYRLYKITVTMDTEHGRKLSIPRAV